MIDVDLPHGPELSVPEKIAYVQEQLEALDRHGDHAAIYYTRHLKATHWFDNKDVQERVEKKVAAVEGKHTQEERFAIEVAAWREYLEALKVALVASTDISSA